VKRPSASNAEAFVRCTASHVLPQHESYAAKTERGTGGHTLLANVINRFPNAAAKLEEEFPGLAAELVEAMDGVEAAVSEEAYVVDVQARTSAFLGTNIDRKYEEALGRPLNPYEICTSIDVHGRRGGKRWVRDFKFGVYHGWWQLYIQAMAVLWLPGREEETEVDAGFTFIEDRDGVLSMTSDAKTLYVIDLDQRASELMAAFEKAKELDKLRPEDMLVVEGKWCQYCGAFPHCPAKWRLAKAMLGADLIGNVDALTPSQCGEAWLKLGEVKRNVIEKLEAALKERMRTEGGFPLEGGKRLKVVPMPGRLGFDQQGAIALLEELGANENQIAALVKRGESFDSVRKVNDK
jgi:hypothetical protein